MSASPPLLFDVAQGVATLTFNRPDALNALNTATFDALDACLDDLDARPEVRALILTGAGERAFIAGADIKEMADMSQGEAWRFARRGQRILGRLAGGRWLTIAAVGGFALGGGCEVALACDLIYASERASFGQPEVVLGVIPGFGGTQRLLRRLGPMRARELLLTGRRVRADEALRLGLINDVVPPDALIERARAVAAEVLSRGPLAIDAARALITRGAEMPLDEALRLEAEAFAGLFETHDQREGMAAFIDKRPADFKGA